MTSKNKKKKSPTKFGSSDELENHMDLVLRPANHQLRNPQQQQVYLVEDYSRHLKIMQEASPDLLFDSRFDSFMQNDWPFSEPEGDLCNPNELAIAGLAYIKSSRMLCARCVVCGCVLTDLKRNSNPWKLHAAMKPDCTIIKIGKPKKPDGYTMKQLADIFLANHIGVLERCFGEMRDNVTRDMLQLQREGA